MHMASTLLRWALQSGVPQVVLWRAARQGQLGARLAVDRSLWDDPFPTYEQMRARGPLIPGGLVWSTTSHPIAEQVLRSSSFGVGVGVRDRLSPVVRRLLSMSADPWAVGPAEPPSMLAVDPPDHTRYRRLVAKVFTPRAMAGMQSRVEEITTELLDDMEGAGAVDLVEAFAAPLPVRVIAEILGVPVEAHADMLRWGNAAAVTLDPALRYSQFRTATDALRQIHSWLANHLAALQANPGDDLLSQLAQLVDAGETLNDVELRATALLVIGAGFETTVNLIANGVVQLLAHPEQLEILRARPELWPNAVDEILRFDSPVQATVRIAQSDVELDGRTVPEGTFVSLMLGGANRDPDVFTNPQRFDVTRSNAKDHLAFSAGIHYCLGAGLARLEGAVALRMLFERFPGIQINGPPQRRHLRVLRGYDHLPVRLSAPAPTSRTA